jgi:20S proteasome subunit alpha 6
MGAVPMYGGPGPGHQHGGGQAANVSLGGGGGRGGGGGGGGGGGRGGNPGRGVRGSGSMTMGGSRGGMASRGGRGGGSSYSVNSGGGGGGRSGGGGGAGQSSGPLRGHGSRGGFGNKDFHNRRGGGSFGGGSGSGGGGGGGGHSHHQQNASFRGRMQGHPSSGRMGGRQDGGGSFGVRDGPTNTSFGNSGKKDENRRTLTDFKISGLEILDLKWNWGVLPSAQPQPSSPMKTEVEEILAAVSAAVNGETALDSDVASVDHPEAEGAPSPSVPDGLTTAAKEVLPKKELKSTPTEVAILPAQEASNSFTSPPPSRIRIYFHTPVTMDDSHPPAHSSGVFVFGSAPSDSRKGKRKKLEDDDGDFEEGRARPPPPRMASALSDEHSSVAPTVDVDGAGSVAESVSEGDWLMAAIAEGDDGHDTDEHSDAEAEEPAPDVHEIPDIADADTASAQPGEDHEKDGE